jgi:hypothetical protein
MGFAGLMKSVLFGLRSAVDFELLRTGSMRSCYAHQCEESETPYLLDPTNPADADLLAFEEDGNAAPAPDADDWEEQRVTECIKRLKLNEHEALAEARRAIWQQVVREADSFLMAKSRCGTGANPGAPQKKLTTKISD